MVEVKSDNSAFFDVDETLVFLSEDPHAKDVILIAIPGFPPNAVIPNLKMIEKLKNHKGWGNGVVVWSRSGWQWAKAVVDALGLQDHVDAVMAKPFYYYDDKKCCEFMHNHRYFK